MEICKTFITIQWLTVIPELGSMSFLFYSLHRDFQSWDTGPSHSLVIIPVSTSSPISQGQLPAPKRMNYYENGNRNSKMEFQSQSQLLQKIKNPFIINCSSLLAEGEGRESFRRDVTLGTLSFIGLCFFFWISCLYLCTHCCVQTTQRHSSFWAAWVNLLFALVWFSGGLATLISFLVQNAQDKESNHELCVSKLEIIQSKLYQCRVLLCQASSAKLVSFGLAIFSCWLHILSFIVAIEQHSKEKKGGLSEIGNNTSNPDSPSISGSKTSASLSMASLSNSFSKICTSDLLFSLSGTSSSALLSNTGLLLNAHENYGNNRAIKRQDSDLVGLDIGLDLLGIRSFNETRAILVPGSVVISGSDCSTNSSSSHRRSRLKKSKTDNLNSNYSSNDVPRPRSPRLVRFKGIQKSDQQPQQPLNQNIENLGNNSRYFDTTTSNGNKQSPKMPDAKNNERENLNNENQSPNDSSDSNGSKKSDFDSDSSQSSSSDQKSKRQE